MVAFHTKTYFSPCLEVLDERNFKVGKHYIVSLEKHPSLAVLLHYLMVKPNHVADTTEIQMKVWKQSLQSQGWQQKIRNTIMRIRDFFPYTMAPLIIHADKIFLNRDAITLVTPRLASLDSEGEVLRLVADCPMSSNQIAEHLAVSPATAKRILKKLTETQHLFMTKKGRHVFYTKSVGPPQSRDFSPPV
jgi:hypothetical protein